MSSDRDEIQFDEVSYREPLRLRRPDRDRRFACLAYGNPGPEDLAIFVDRVTVDAIERHALSDTRVELGGILLGKECVDEETGRPFVWISQAIEAKHYENTQASFTYTHDSWEEITRERDRTYPNLDIVGWYHTHPDFGIFLSGHDVFIQQHFFGQPLQVAYVVDPIRQTRGIFQWRDGGLRQVEGYVVVSPRDQRRALARTVDDLEGVLVAESSGGLGALSPRLEAELIAMLNRPHTASVTTADRGQSAAVFTLLGIIFGVLGLALALWIGALTSQIREQSRSLGSLKAELARANEARKASDTAERLRAKEQAIDALLAEVRVGDSNERFTRVYTQLREERDRAVAEAALVEQVGRDLIAKDRELGEMRRQVAIRDQSLAQMEDLREEADRLRSANERLARAASGDGTAIDEVLAGNADGIDRRYTVAWYAAVGGWSVAVLLGLGLVATIARSVPHARDVPEPPAPTGRGGSAEGPHRIDH
ncbi:Mov34/MPN/PAD-1 family protein [Tautonia rosea]|uniref:Mov34/MPN/PAD-1 family protein n=1 Tax=Tautonia rosea TaxID=2728037 RepID=UPI0014745F82|nr:Mov34/MPN/PAD-1 family protein [Tautonia rosea]